MATTYPRPEYTEDLAYAWLTQDEEKMLRAAECRDLRQTFSTSIYMEEARKKKRPTHAEKYGGNGPEAESRRNAASDLLEWAQTGACNYGTMLVVIAQLRRQLHYARLGQTPPELPREEE